MWKNAASHDHCPWNYRGGTGRGAELVSIIADASHHIQANVIRAIMIPIFLQHAMEMLTQEVVLMISVSGYLRQCRTFTRTIN